MSYLLDTRVLAEYLKKQPSPQVIAWLDRQLETRLYLSVISIGEISKGIAKLRATDPPRAERLQTWLETLEQRFEGRILPLDAATMRSWGERYAEREATGTMPPLMDSLLLACAAHHELVMVTRNVADFAELPKVLNPWEVA